MSEVFCFCRRKSEGFMIFCDLCKEWFHGKCINLTKANVPKADEWYCHWCVRNRKVEEALVKKFEEEVEKVRIDLNQEALVHQEVKRLQQQVSVLLEEKRNLEIVIKQNVMKAKRIEDEKESLLLQLQAKEAAMSRCEEDKCCIHQQMSILKQDFIQEKQQLQGALECIAKECDLLKTELAEAKRTEDEKECLTQQLRAKDIDMLRCEQDKHELQLQLSKLEQDLCQGKQQCGDLEILAKENEQLKEKLAAVNRRKRLSLSQK